MDYTPNLELPYMAASQAQKHVTHNEALRALDALVQVSVLSRVTTTPAVSPNPGDRYLIPTGATGLWSGQVGNIAAWQDGAWEFYVPRIGWLMWVVDENSLIVLKVSGWAYAGVGSSVAMTAPVFVTQTSDPINSTIQSNIVTVVGTPATVLSCAVRGPAGSDPTMIVNGVDVGPSCNLINGDSLRLQMLSAPTYGTLEEVTFYGPGVVAVWDVTTIVVPGASILMRDGITVILDRTGDFITSR